MKNVIWPLAVWFLLPHALQLLPAGSHSEYLARHSQNYQSNMEESKAGSCFLLEPEEAKISPLLFCPIRKLKERKLKGSKQKPSDKTTDETYTIINDFKCQIDTLNFRPPLTDSNSSSVWKFICQRGINTTNTFAPNWVWEPVESPR